MNIRSKVLLIFFVLTGTIAQAQIRAYFSDDTHNGDSWSSSTDFYAIRADPAIDMEFNMHLPDGKVGLEKFEGEVRAIMLRYYVPMVRRFDRRRAVLHVSINNRKWAYTYIYEVGPGTPVQKEESAPIAQMSH